MPPSFVPRPAPIGGLPLARDEAEDAALGLAARLVSLGIAVSDLAERAEPR